MLTIICGRAGSGKTSEIYRRVAQGAAEKRRQVILVPETRSHEAERRLLLTCGNAAGAFAAVTTFTKLSGEILRQAGRDTAVLDGGGRVLLMHRAVCDAKTALRYFRGPLRPELLERLLAAADELKACMVAPEALLAACAALPDKLYDIAQIYACYCALCTREGMDGKDLITQAGEALGETGLFCGADVYVDGFAGFTRQEYALLAGLARRARSCCVTLLLGEDEQLFAEQYKTLGRLTRLGEDDAGGCRRVDLPAPEGGRPELRHLEENLYAFGAQPYEGECRAIQLYNASDPDAECELAAGLMRRLLLDGARAREIAAVCGGADLYAEKLENACARYGVPVFVSRQQDILKKPAFLGALGGLRALLDGLRPDSVLPWLKSGLCGLARDERERLENYLLTWNIAGAKWREEWKLPPSGFSGGEGDGEALAALNAIRLRIWQPLARLSEALDSCRTGADYAAAMLEHWRDTALEERLDERVEALLAADRRREAAEYAQLYDILRQAVDQFVLIVGETPMDREQFEGLLRLMLSQYDVGTIPVSLDCVVMGDFDRLSLSGVRHLFVLGACDGLLPPALPSGTLLSEPERILLEGVGIELTQTAEERAFETQSAIYHAFASPSGSLNILCPGVGSGGEECRESYLVRRLRALFPGLTARRGEDELPLLMLTAPTPAYELACTAAGGGGGAPAAFALEALGQEEGTGPLLQKLRRYAEAPRGPMKKPDNIRALYGEHIRLTASRIERVATCRFSYFMQYGLRAKPVRRAQFGPPEIGTLVHYVIENAVQTLCSQPETTPRQAAELWAGRYVRERLGEAAGQSARLRGLLRALTRHAAAIVENVWEEIQSSDFVPLQFELSFGDGGQLPPLRMAEGDVTLSVGGKIDRVDGYVRGDRLYLKVVDYKTGSKSFRLSDVLYGLNMQMFLYLLMLEKGAKSPLLRLAREKTGEEAQDTAVAGALYIPAKDPFVPAEAGEDEQAIRDRLDRELRRIGIVSAEENILAAMERASEGKYRFLPVALDKSGGLSARSSVASAEQFGRLLRKVEGTLAAIAQSLTGGDVEATPYRLDRERSVCDFCDFRAACHFDQNRKGDALRYYPKLRDSEVHALLEEEEHAGHLYDGAAKGH